MSKIVTDREAHFWSKVDVKSDGECWNYLGYKNQKGYGRFHTPAGTISAHRYAWELHYKQKVPKDMMILHHCDNPACCNHLHLYCGTNFDNMRDKSRRHIDLKQFAANSKLYADEMLQIRKLNKTGVSQRELAKIFNVGQTTIGKVIRGENKYSKLGAKHAIL